jgi:endonuclease/exonuclease/phosphatase family metal-dependent hydrolase
MNYYIWGTVFWLIVAHNAAATKIPAYASTAVSRFGPREWRAVSLPRPRTLYVATYNVWFESMHNEERHPAIAQMLAATDADVICLQEVTANFLRCLKSSSVIQRQYACIGLHGETIRNGAFHGCVILVNRKTLTADAGTYYYLPMTFDNRHLLTAKVSGVVGTHTEGIHDLTVATAHLESESSIYGEGSRRAQLQFIKDSLPFSGGVFCGDTNLCRSGEDRTPENLGYYDAWTETGHPNDTPTWDSLYPSKFPPRRLDRILFTGPSIHAREASLFGETPLHLKKPIERTLFLSDHKGVLARMLICRE